MNGCTECSWSLGAAAVECRDRSSECGRKVTACRKERTFHRPAIPAAGEKFCRTSPAGEASLAPNNCFLRPRRGLHAGAA